MTNTFFIPAFKITRKTGNKEVSWLNTGIETEISSETDSDIVLPECKNIVLRIWIEQDSFFARTTGSEKVIIDGKILKNGKKTSLKLPSDVFFNDTSLKIEYLFYTPGQTPENLKTLIENSSLRRFLRFKHQNEITLMSLPVEGELFIGRNPGNHLILRHPGLSGNHLSMKFSKNGIFVTDLNSKNGVFYEKKRIKHGFLWSGNGILTAGNTEISIFFNKLQH